MGSSPRSKLSIGDKGFKTELTIDTPGSFVQFTYVGGARLACC